MGAVKAGLGVLCVALLGLAGCGQDMLIDLADRGVWVRLPDPPLSGGARFGPDGSALLADAYMWTP